MSNEENIYKLENFEDMLNFGLEEEKNDGLAEIRFDKMQSFPNHKFKLYEGQQLDDMVESIKEFGILLPIILWLDEDKNYIILSGHNRKNAGVIAGLEVSPVIIKENLTIDEATLIVTETNLRQRSFTDLLHSEKALCLAEHYGAIKSQGKRNDILNELKMLINPVKHSVLETCSQVANKAKSISIVGAEYNLSKDNVARYIRVSKLVLPLLEMLDNSEIAFLTAYTISFIEDEETQQQIAKIIESGEYRLDMKKAELLRQHFENGKLNETSIEQILSGETSKKAKSKPSKEKSHIIKPKILSRFFSADESKKEIEDVIVKALEMYFEKQEEQVEQGNVSN